MGGYLEEKRDEIVTILIRYVQGGIRGFMARNEYKKRKLQRDLLKVIQRNFRKYMSLRNWGWFSIIQKTRPLIGMINIEEEIKILEDAAAKAISAYEKELADRKKFEQSNAKLLDDKLLLLNRIESEQGELQVLQERQAKASAQKADLEVQLDDIQEKIVETEEQRETLIKDKKEIENENSNVRGDLSDLEIQVQKCEQERTNRDHQIRSLNEEITTIDELISKLNKEKKYIQETNSKASEELQVADDKVSHL